MTTLSLEASKRVFELIGEYETDNRHNDSLPKNTKKYLGSGIHVTDPLSHSCRRQGCAPAPTFAELIRVLPRIGEKKGWAEYRLTLSEGEKSKDIGEAGVTAMNMGLEYMSAPTEPKGMAEVEEYLMKLIA